LEVLDRDAPVAEASCHALPLEDAARVRAVPDGAAVTEVLVRAVRAWKAAELVTLHHARRAAPLADAAHVDGVAGGEDIGDAHVLADRELRIGADFELAQHAEGAFRRLCDVAVHRLTDAALLLRREPELHGGVAVAGFRLLLHDGAWPRLDDGHRHEVS